MGSVNLSRTTLAVLILSIVVCCITTLRISKVSYFDLIRNKSKNVTPGKVANILKGANFSFNKDDGGDFWNFQGDKLFSEISQISMEEFQK